MSQDSFNELILETELIRKRRVSELVHSLAGEKFALDPCYEMTLRLKALTDRFTRHSAHSIVDPYFHRLSGNIVLAIIMIERPDGERDYFEGVNTEVAPQSGSICAERTAISSARVKYPEMRRSWIKAAAAIFVPEDLKAGAPLLDKNPCWPCSLCIEWLRKMGKYPGSVRVFAYNNFAMDDLVLERFVKLSVDIPMQPAAVETCDKCGCISQKNHPGTMIHGCPFCKLPGDTPTQSAANLQSMTPFAAPQVKSIKYIPSA